MKTLAFVVPLFATLLASTVSAEEVTVDFQYTLDHRVDFSKIRRGPLQVETFTDARDVESPNVIAPGYTADQPLAAIVRDALIQGFVQGKAMLADSDGNLHLEGNIETSEVEMVDTNGVPSIQLTIRTRVKLQGYGRTMFQTVLFGRGTVPVEDGIAAALNAALGRTIRGLVQDDYFLNEIM